MKKDSFDESSSNIHAANLKKLRKFWNENQTEFWCRFGVTQSRGSRFEKGIGIPPSVAILMELYFEKKIDDVDLLNARHSSTQPAGLESKVSLVIDRTGFL